MKTRLLAIACALLLMINVLPASYALTGDISRAADTLYTLGLVKGVASGDYALDAPATRAQAAVLLVRLSGEEKSAQAVSGSDGFTDIPDWAASAVRYGSQKGWFRGVGGGAFHPDQVITANAWCAFLLRMLGYSDTAGDFTVSDAAVFAQRIGLTARTYSGTLTRGDLFEIAAGALTFSYRDGSGTVIAHLVEGGICSQASANALGLLTPELTARQAADRHLSAVFCLQTYASQAQVNSGNPYADASGFFITGDGLAVTNYHSISGAVCATATLSTGEVYPVDRVIYYDEDIDVAVLRISKTSLDGASTSMFAHLDMVGTEELRAGDTVYALSNPLGLGLSVSSGVVSDPSREAERYALPCVMNTADMSQGSSGGALLNVYGQVVAITAGAYTYGNSMYLAVPVDPVMQADLNGKGWTLAEVAAAESAD